MVTGWIQVLWKEDSSEIFIFLVFQRDRRHWEKDQVRKMNIMDLILGTFSLMWFSRYICEPRNFSGLELTISWWSYYALCLFGFAWERLSGNSNKGRGIRVKIWGTQIFASWNKRLHLHKRLFKRGPENWSRNQEKKSLMDIKIRQQHKK